MKEIHIAKTQVAGEQDVQDILPAEALPVTRDHVEHEHFGVHVPGEFARFRGGPRGRVPQAMCVVC